MTARNGLKKPKRLYTKTGYHAAKRALQRFGTALIDRRTKLGRDLERWQAALVDQLGGLDNLTPAQLEILELASRQKALVSMLDSVLLLMQAPVNKRTLSAFPIVGQRGQEADRLVRYLQLLGLDRKAKPVPSLGEYVEQRYGGNGEGA